MMTLSDFSNARSIKVMMKAGDEKIIKANRILEERRTIFMNDDEVTAEICDGEYVGWHVVSEDEQGTD